MKQWKVSVRNNDETKDDIEWLIAAEDEDTAADIGFKNAAANPEASTGSISVDQYPLDTEDREDKEEILYRLCDTLRMTREYMELGDLIYDKEREIVTAIFGDGKSKRINVACDSGIAMIRDILRNLR